MDGSPARFSLSPDGRQVAFTRTDREREVSALITANLDGTGEREVLTRSLDKHFNSFGPTWSPDGSMLAAAAVNDSAKQREEIFIVRVADGQAEQLTALEWIRINNLVWLQRRGLIAVAVDRSETLKHLWHIAYPGGTAHRLSRDTDSYGLALSISADGSSLLAVQLRRESNIWVAPANDLFAARQVTFSSINGAYGWNGLDWTPGGGIVFTAGIDRTQAIYSMDADGGKIKQLTSAGFTDGRPNVTADGLISSFNRTAAAAMKSGASMLMAATSDS